MNNSQSSDQVLTFWLGELDSNGMASDERAARWWKKDPAFDAEVRDKFQADHQALLRGNHMSWLRSPDGKLAAIIVLDQFSRNMFRDTPEMFSGDQLALKLAIQMLTEGSDQTFLGDARTFAYMPFMHAEDIAEQRRCVELFKIFARNSEEPLKKRVQNNLEFARAHCDIIDRFGRFPHRNRIVGRTSTPEELEFLKQENSSF